MTDSNVIGIAIQSHLESLRHATGAVLRTSMVCKVCSIVIVAGVLYFAVGKERHGAVRWAVGALILLAIADAGQVALTRGFTEAYNRLMRKVPLNGGNAMKSEECFVLPAREMGLRHSGAVLGALSSFSVWPFHCALLALVFAFQVPTSPPAAGAKTARAAGCAAGGGCGASGGCGSGGCGASSGKGCGCGSASARGAASVGIKASGGNVVPPLNRPLQQATPLQPIPNPPSSAARPVLPAGEPAKEQPGKAGQSPAKKLQE